MNNFTFYAPTKVVFGKGTESQVGALVAAQNCKKVLLHYGSGSVKKTGLLDRVKKSLDESGISYVELGGVVPNPRLSLVREGIALCKKEGVDFLLAVGGGSVIDSAKAIGYGCANDFDVWDIFERKNQPKACLPVGVVLTIAAAGSEMSNSAVITNEDGWKKRGSNSDTCRPKFAIMNPELTMTLPEYQTMCGSTDILMHTMERYFTSQGNMELTDSIAEGLMRTVISNTKILLKNPKDYDARAEIMWASSLSHNDLTGLGNGGNDFASHRLEHELGGMFDVAHGAGLAASGEAGPAMFTRNVCIDLRNLPLMSGMFRSPVLMKKLPSKESRLWRISTGKSKCLRICGNSELHRRTSRLTSLPKSVQSQQAVMSEVRKSFMKMTCGRFSLQRNKCRVGCEQSNT